MALSKLLIKVLEPKKTKKLEEALENIDFSKIKNLEELQKIQENLYYDSDILPEESVYSMIRGGVMGCILFSIFSYIINYDAAASVEKNIGASFLGAFPGFGLGVFLGNGIYHYFSSAINRKIKKKAKKAGIIEYKKLKREKDFGTRLLDIY